MNFYIPIRASESLGIAVLSCCDEPRTSRVWMLISFVVSVFLCWLLSVVHERDVLFCHREFAFVCVGSTSGGSHLQRYAFLSHPLHIHVFQNENSDIPNFHNEQSEFRIDIFETSECPNCHFENSECPNFHF